MEPSPHHPFYELSLFSGAGGGLLGSKLLGWTTVGYVENNDYCQKVLAQRIEDGILDQAPIFGDINGFIESGAAKKYKGFVDVVTGGFPCQPFSTAGKRKAQDDSRNLWPQTLAVLCDVRPRYALLENVPGLLTVNGGGYFAQILADLAEARFDARWCVLGADDVGAPHRRKRLWIVATYQDALGSGRMVRETQEGRVQVREQRELSPRGGERISGNPPDVADSDSGGTLRRSGRTTGTIQETPSRTKSKGTRFTPPAFDSSSDVADSDSERRRLRETDRKDAEDAGQSSRRSEYGYWDVEPDVGRVAHGVASRVDRLKAIGNGQVPLVAATAWKLLSGQELESI